MVGRRKIAPDYDYGNSIEGNNLVINSRPNSGQPNTTDRASVIDNQPKSNDNFLDDAIAPDTEYRQSYTWNKVVSNNNNDCPHEVLSQSEYKTSFGWPKNGREVQSKEYESTIPGKAVAVEGGLKKSSTISSFTDVVDKPEEWVPVREAHALPGPEVKMKKKTEYNAKFRPFSAYVYVTGNGFKKPKDFDQMDEVDKAKHWYSEVEERNRQANHYKTRSQLGHPLASEGLTQIYSQGSVWNTYHRDRNLQALDLQTTQMIIEEKKQERRGRSASSAPKTGRKRCLSSAPPTMRRELHNTNTASVRTKSPQTTRKTTDSRSTERAQPKKSPKKPNVTPINVNQMPKAEGKIWLKPKPKSQDTSAEKKPVPKHLPLDTNANETKAPTNATEKISSKPLPPIHHKTETNKLSKGVTHTTPANSVKHSAPNVKTNKDIIKPQTLQSIDTNKVTPNLNEEINATLPKKRSSKDPITPLSGKTPENEVFIQIHSNGSLWNQRDRNLQTPDTSPNSVTKPLHPKDKSPSVSDKSDEVSQKVSLNVDKEPVTKRKESLSVEQPLKDSSEKYETSQHISIDPILVSETNQQVVSPKNTDQSLKSNENVFNIKDNKQDIVSIDMDETQSPLDTESHLKSSNENINESSLTVTSNINDKSLDNSFVDIPKDKVEESLKDKSVESLIATKHADEKDLSVSSQLTEKPLETGSVSEYLNTSDELVDNMKGSVVEDKDTNLKSVVDNKEIDIKNIDNVSNVSQEKLETDKQIDSLNTTKDNIDTTMMSPLDISSKPVESKDSLVFENKPINMSSDIMDKPFDTEIKTNLSNISDVSEETLLKDNPIESLSQTNEQKSLADKQIDSKNISESFKTSEESIDSNKSSLIDDKLTSDKTFEDIVTKESNQKALTSSCDISNNQIESDNVLMFNKSSASDDSLLTKDQSLKLMSDIGDKRVSLTEESDKSLESLNVVKDSVQNLSTVTVSSGVFDKPFDSKDNFESFQKSDESIDHKKVLLTEETIVSDKPIESLSVAKDSDHKPPTVSSDINNKSIESKDSLPSDKTYDFEVKPSTMSSDYKESNIQQKDNSSHISTESLDKLLADKPIESLSLTKDSDQKTPTVDSDITNKSIDSKDSILFDKSDKFEDKTLTVGSDIDDKELDSQQKVSTFNIDKPLTDKPIESLSITKDGSDKQSLITSDSKASDKVIETKNNLLDESEEQKGAKLMDSSVIKKPEFESKDNSLNEYKDRDDNTLIVSHTIEGKEKETKSSELRDSDNELKDSFDYKQQEVELNLNISSIDNKNTNQQSICSEVSGKQFESNNNIFEINDNISVNKVEANLEKDIIDKSLSPKQSISENTLTFSADINEKSLELQSNEMSINMSKESVDNKSMESLDINKDNNNKPMTVSSDIISESMFKDVSEYTSEGTESSDSKKVSLVDDKPIKFTTNVENKQTDLHAIDTFWDQSSDSQEKLQTDKQIEPKNANKAIDDKTFKAGFQISDKPIESKESLLDKEKSLDISGNVVSKQSDLGHDDHFFDICYNDKNKLTDKSIDTLNAFKESDVKPVTVSSGVFDKPFDSKDNFESFQKSDESIDHKKVLLTEETIVSDKPIESLSVAKDSDHKPLTVSSDINNKSIESNDSLLSDKTYDFEIKPSTVSSDYKESNSSHISTASLDKSIAIDKPIESLSLTKDSDQKTSTVGSNITTKPIDFKDSILSDKSEDFEDKPSKVDSDIDSKDFQQKDNIFTINNKNISETAEDSSNKKSLITSDSKSSDKEVKVTVDVMDKQLETKSSILFKDSEEIMFEDKPIESFNKTKDSDQKLLLESKESSGVDKPRTDSFSFEVKPIVTQETCQTISIDPKIESKPNQQVVSPKGTDKALESNNNVFDTKDNKQNLFSINKTETQSSIDTKSQSKSADQNNSDSSLTVSSNINNKSLDNSSVNITSKVEESLKDKSFESLIVTKDIDDKDMTVSSHLSDKPIATGSVSEILDKSDKLIESKNLNEKTFDNKDTKISSIIDNKQKDISFSSLSDDQDKLQTDKQIDSLSITEGSADHSMISGLQMSDKQIESKGSVTVEDKSRVKASPSIVDKQYDTQIETIFSNISDTSKDTLLKDKPLESLSTTKDSDQKSLTVSHKTDKPIDSEDISESFKVSEESIDFKTFLIEDKILSDKPFDDIVTKESDKKSLLTESTKIITDNQTKTDSTLVSNKLSDSYDSSLSKPLEVISESVKLMTDKPIESSSNTKDNNDKQSLITIDNKASDKAIDSQTKSVNKYEEQSVAQLTDTSDTKMIFESKDSCFESKDSKFTDLSAFNKSYDNELKESFDYNVSNIKDNGDKQSLIGSFQSSGKPLDTKPLRENINKEETKLTQSYQIEKPFDFKDDSFDSKDSDDNSIKFSYFTDDYKTDIKSSSDLSGFGKSDDNKVTESFNFDYATQDFSLTSNDNKINEQLVSSSEMKDKSNNNVFDIKDNNNGQTVSSIVIKEESVSQTQMKDKPMTTSQIINENPLIFSHKSDDKSSESKDTVSKSSEFGLYTPTDKSLESEDSSDDSEIYEYSLDISKDITEKPIIVSPNIPDIPSETKTKTTL